ncbi:MAG TPA: endo-1,4-beta-xylanase [Pirellulales bacterium]
MGLMRFLVAPPNRVSPDAVQRAYMLASDQIPWVTRTSMQDGVLSVSRNESDSGCLCFPLAVEGRGEVALTTGTLVERFQPYNLLVELARGKILQIRNQIWDWQGIGLRPKEAQLAVLRQAQNHLAAAVTSQHDPAAAAGHAELAIRAALDVCDLLASRYAGKIIAARRQRAPQLPTLLGVDLGHRPIKADLLRRVRHAFNAAAVPLAWREVEMQEGAYRWDVYDRQIDWCRASKLQVVAGPCVQFDNRGLPDWLAIWQGDFDNLTSFVSDYVETVVHRYRGKVDVWQCASRVNTGEVLGLGAEDRLRLAARACEITRRIDPKTPVIIRFDQPWGEYMGREECDVSPIHYADILVRSGIELSGIGLDWNIGYWPDGSYLRDPLQCSRLIDRWAVLGLPLWIFLTLPSGQGPDRRAYGRGRPVGGVQPEGWTPATQRKWLREFAPLLVAKPAVQGIIYNQLRDSRSHELPHGGLFGRDDAPKPALGTMARLRRKYLS